MGAQAKLEQQALGMRCAHCLAYVAKMHVLPSLAPIPTGPVFWEPCGNHRLARVRSDWDTEKTKLSFGGKTGAGLVTVGLSEAE